MSQKFKKVKIQNKILAVLSPFIILTTMALVLTSIIGEFIFLIIWIGPVIGGYFYYSAFYQIKKFRKILLFTIPFLIVIGYVNFNPQIQEMIPNTLYYVLEMSDTSVAHITLKTVIFSIMFYSFAGISVFFINNWGKKWNKQFLESKNNESI